MPPDRIVISLESSNASNHTPMFGVKKQLPAEQGFFHKPALRRLRGTGDRKTRHSPAFIKKGDQQPP